MNAPTDLFSILQAYQRSTPVSASPIERFFGLLAVVVCMVFGAVGLYLTTVKVELPRAAVQTLPQRVRGQFIIRQPVTPSPPPTVKRLEPRPVDLTHKPAMAQKEEIEQKTSAPATAPARRVFGLRRVFATGIGATGSMADAVIGKLGNTIEKEFDTLTATDRDVKGQVVSATTVTNAPKIKKYIKPQYTQEMLDRRIEGTIKVRVLVDIDGKVVKAVAMNDLGYGSVQEALKACFSMEFEPARRGEEAVAVWIIVPVKFVLLG